MENTLQLNQQEIDKLFYDVFEDVNKTSFFLYIYITLRGLGKTYSTLRGVIKSGKQFLYLRRTDTEIKNCCSEINNPFKSLNDDYGWNIQVKSYGDMYQIIDTEENKVYGVACSLSTFGKFRGSDFREIDYIVYDEFINTSPINYLKPSVEISLFFNMLETIIRNREVAGLGTIKIILLSNANSMDSGIIQYLRLGEILREMKESGEEFYHDDERGIFIGMPTKKGLVEKKKETSLYKLAKGTDFYEMAMNNNFTTENFNVVKRIPHNKLDPYCSYNNMYFYIIKDTDELYCTTIKNNINHFTKNSRKQFERTFLQSIIFYRNNNKIKYLNYDLKLMVDDLIK